MDLNQARFHHDCENLVLLLELEETFWLSRPITLSSTIHSSLSSAQAFYMFPQESTPRVCVDPCV